MLVSGIKRVQSPAGYGIITTYMPTE